MAADPRFASPLASPRQQRRSRVARQTAQARSAMSLLTVSPARIPTDEIWLCGGHRPPGSPCAGPAGPGARAGPHRRGDHAARAPTEMKRRNAINRSAPPAAADARHFSLARTRCPLRRRGAVCPFSPPPPVGNRGSFLSPPTLPLSYPPQHPPCSFSPNTPPVFGPPLTSLLPPCPSSTPAYLRVLSTPHPGTSLHTAKKTIIDIATR